MNNEERIEQLLPYVKAESELIKLYKWDARRSDGRPLGKTPIGKKWGAKPALDEEMLHEIVEGGYNIGYRMTVSDLVVDIDFRNFNGEDSLVKLCRDIGEEELSDDYPTVLTGGGGFHFYMKLPDGITVHHTLKDYPGIEFKTKGRQVVAAGSRHPSGNYYVWDDFSADLKDTPLAPSRLLDLIGREAKPEEFKGKGWGELSAEKLGEILSLIPVEHFGSNDHWEPLMMACHHATAGLGEEEFLHWSIQDPEYLDDENVIRNRWSSLDSRDDGITIGTLHMLLKPFGVNVAEEVRKDAADEFKDYIDDYEKDYEEDYEAENSESGLALEIAEKLGSDPTEKQLKQAVRAAEQAGAIEKNKAKELIRAKMGITKREFNEVVKDLVSDEDKLQPTVENILNVLDSRKTGWEFTYDAFLDEVLCKAPGSNNRTVYSDLILTDIRIAVGKHVSIGIGGKEVVRDVVERLAHQFEIDSAQNWLENLEWDGVKRVERFCTEYLMANTDEYSKNYLKALGRYIWSGLAGRVLAPGCQLDILPVFYGEQGCGKSTAVKTMCPKIDTHVEISFTRNEETLARMMRGKLIGELAELNGLHSREAEHIKAFVTRTHEEWVPKYKEVATRFPRRLMMIGTTNEQEFLSDATGNRRWAPLEVGLGDGVDRDKIRNDRKQLWAEGREMFKENGVMYSDLEALLVDHQESHQIRDLWEETIEHWLENWPTENGVTTHQIGTMALDVPMDRMNRGVEIRVAKTLKRLKWVRKKRRVDGKLKWRWYRS